MSAPSETPNDATSMTLLGSAKSHDPAAWRRLVQLYSPSIFHWAKRAELQDEDAADIVQEVWTSITTNLEKFHRDQDTGTFRGWLWTITRNKIRDWARRDSASGTGGTDAQMALQNVPEIEPEEHTTSDTPGMIDRALELIRSDFEPHTWQAFWRVAVLNQSARDVAADLGMAANAVHQAKFRILKRLRQELTNLGVVDDPSFSEILPTA